MNLHSTCGILAKSHITHFPLLAEINTFIFNRQSSAAVGLFFPTLETAGFPEKSRQTVICSQPQREQCSLPARPWSPALRAPSGTPPLRSRRLPLGQGRGDRAARGCCCCSRTAHFVFASCYAGLLSRLCCSRDSASPYGGLFFTSARASLLPQKARGNLSPFTVLLSMAKHFLVLPDLRFEALKFCNCL